MKIHRSSMEKILHQQEQDTVITDPKQPVRTFFRKLRYYCAVWKDRSKRTKKS